jgi:hypothetical protein
VRLQEFIEHPVLQEPLGVWPASGTERAIGTDVLMDDSHTVALHVVIGDRLTPGAQGLGRARWTGVVILEQDLAQLTGLGTLPVASVVESLA